jgi:hypothetical protein
MVKSDVEPVSPIVSTERVDKAKGTHFLLICQSSKLRLNLARPLKSVNDALFSNCAWRSSSIFTSAWAIRLVMPSAVLKISTVKTPTLLDDKTMSSLSN